MINKKNILIVNYYGDNENNPGGKRTLLWKEFFKGNNVYFSFPSNVENNSWIIKIALRVKNFIFGTYPSLPKKWVSEVNELILSSKYDLIVLCCPEYSVCDFIPLASEQKVLVDIRDGIYFESLWSYIEKWRYKRKLLSFEENLKDVHILTTNIPGLKKYYQNKFNKPVYLLLNHSIFSKQKFTYKSNFNNKNEFRLLYTGGLMKSSIGQNLLNLCFSIKILNSKGKKITLTMLGRFNPIEKMIYTKLFNFVEIKNEVPEVELSDISKYFDCFVISNTTKRDLLPSKFWFYIKSNIPILSISPSYSLDYISQLIDGIVTTDRTIMNISDKIESLLLMPTFDRNDLNIKDDKDEIGFRLENI